MGIKKEDVASAVIALGVMAWLFRLPEVVWAKLHNRPAPRSIYVPSMSRVRNPGNMSLEEVIKKEENHV